MAKRSFSLSGTAFTSVPDGTAFTTGQYMALTGGSGTQVGVVYEVSVSGQASASQVANGMFARDAAGSGAASALASPFADGFLNSAGSALSTSFSTFTNLATTQPNRPSTATNARLNISINAFGGIYRWVAAPGEEWTIIGTGTGVESSLSFTTANSGAATVNAGAHIIYEPI